MKRTFNFQNKTFLKYLIVILLILLSGSFLLLRSYKNTPSKEVKKKDNSAEIKRFTDLGDQFYNRYSLDTALIYFNKALILCDPKKNTQDYVYAAYSIAYVYNDKGDYNASEAAAILALPYLKNLKKQGMPGLYILYWEQTTHLCTIITMRYYTIKKQEI